MTKKEKEQRECEAREYAKPRERQRNAWTFARMIGSSNFLEICCRRISLWEFPDYFWTGVLFHHINETPTQLSQGTDRLIMLGRNFHKTAPFYRRAYGTRSELRFLKNCASHGAVWHGPVIPVTAGRRCHMSCEGSRGAVKGHLAN